MSQPNPRITITRRSVCRAALPLALALRVLAHNGFDHVIGTVVRVENGILTVRTAKGNVDVRLDAKTEITRNDHALPPGELKPGARVVVDIPEGSKDRIAHSVKVGVTPAAHH